MKRAWALAAAWGDAGVAPRARRHGSHRLRSSGGTSHGGSIHRRRGPVRPSASANGALVEGAPRRPRRARASRRSSSARSRSRRRRRRRLRLRGHDRPAGRRHRAHVLARRGPAGRGARRDRRPAVRLVAAGRALRGAGGDERHAGPRRRGRRAEHEPDPDQRVDDRRGPVSALRDPFAGSSGLERALRHAGRVAVPVGRDDRREVGHHARARWRRFALESHRRAVPRDRREALRPRDRPCRRAGERRGPAARDHAREDGDAAAADARAGASPPRVSSQISDGAAALLIASERAVQRARSEAARAHPSPVACAAPTPSGCSPRRSRRRVRALQKAGHELDRHRSRGDQRGVRLAWSSRGRRSSPRILRASTSTAARIALGHPLGRHRARG